MSISIRLKHSATANKAPQPADLKDGELALNTNAASPAAYIKDSAGNIVKLAGAGAIGGTPASETAAGIAELATQAEVTAGTDDQRIVTPLKLATAVPAASETAAGKVELATAAETTTGTDNTRAVHPAGLKVELDKLKLWSRTGTTLSPVTAGDVVNISAGTAALPGLTPVGDPNTGIYSPGADQVAVSTGGNERARIDSSGRLLVGTSTADTTHFASVGNLFVEGAGDAASSLVQTCWKASDTSQAFHILAKSGGASVGTRGIVASGERLGAVAFEGDDGTNFISAALVRAEVDGTPGANDMPGRLVFSTTASGKSTPTERMRIKSDGTINYSKVAVYADNAAATAGGLFAGDVYRKADGTLMITF